MTVTQDAFTGALLAPERPVPTGLTNPDGRPATKRFDVYRNNVTVSLSDALAMAFPVIKKLLGDQNFGNLARLFLRQHPPSSPILAVYGAEFPAFLERFEPLKHLGYLADVARLEQALREAYHAADATPVAADALQALPPATLMQTRLHLAPATRLLRSPWPVLSIWQFNAQDGAPKPAMQAEDVLILRPEFDPEALRLGPGAADFIAAIRAGATLGEAFDTAATDAPTFDLTALLGQLLTGQAITALDHTK